MSTGSNIKSAYAFRKGASSQGHDELRKQTRAPANEYLMWINWWIATGPTVLVVSDCTHEQTAENVNLIENKTLTVNNTVHQQTCESPVLIQNYTLVVSDCVHDHTAESPGLIQNILLSVQDCTHEQTAEDVHLYFWKENFIKIPTEKVTEYTQKEVTWWWGLDCRGSISDGHVLAHSLINDLETTPIIKDLSEEIVEDLETMEVKELKDYDFE